MITIPHTINHDTNDNKKLHIQDVPDIPDTPIHLPISVRNATAAVIR